MAKNKKGSPWLPLPAGAIVAFIFGPTALVYLILAIYLRQINLGILAFFMGALAIFETSNAGVHAGLRIQSHADELLRRDPISIWGMTMTMTRHGHRIKGTTIEDDRKGAIAADCGGPGGCFDCTNDELRAFGRIAKPRKPGQNR